MQQNNISRQSMTILAVLTLLSACRAGPDGGAATDSSADWRDADPAIARAATGRMEQELATVETQLDSLPGLIGSVRGTLRRYLNDEHIARARSLGVAPVEDTAGVARLVHAGRLVRLPDSTQHWVVRELDQSLPYVTPDKKTALEELGDRFHARLASAGLPPFRFEISSALRTGVLQQELRTRNANASRKESSHEFGTTVDIAYNEFAPPSPDTWAPWRDAIVGQGDAEAALRARIDAIAAVRLDSLGSTYSDHLKGELGAVLQQMQEEGRIWPLYERSQPVFHTTLAGSERARAANGQTTSSSSGVSTAAPAGARR
jgi:hypothetical protein